MLITSLSSPRLLLRPRLSSCRHRPQHLSRQRPSQRRPSRRRPPGVAARVSGVPRSPRGSSAQVSDSQFVPALVTAMLTTRQLKSGRAHAPRRRLRPLSHRTPTSTPRSTARKSNYYSQPTTHSIQSGRPLDDDTITTAAGDSTSRPHMVTPPSPALRPSPAPTSLATLHGRVHAPTDTRRRRLPSCRKDRSSPRFSGCTRVGPVNSRLKRWKMYIREGCFSSLF